MIMSSHAFDNTLKMAKNRHMKNMHCCFHLVGNSDFTFDFCFK